MQDLKARTQRFALDVIRLARSLPRGDEFVIVRRQIIRASTSVAANDRVARRARSRPDVLSKPGIVEEEAGKRLFWLEVLKKPAAGGRVELDRLLAAADELVAIVVSSRQVVGI